MRNKKITFTLSFLTLIFAVLSWGSIYRAIMIPNVSVWMVPIVVFSFFIIFLSLDLLLIADTMWVEILIMGSLMLSFIFTHDIQHLIGVILGGVCVLIGMHGIRRDVDQNTKIRPWKSLQVGRVSLILGISLIITSQYYFIIQTDGGQRAVPKIDVSSIIDRYSIPILKFIYPQLGDAEADITIDEFILRAERDREDEALQDLSEEYYLDLPESNQLEIIEARKKELEVTKANLIEKENQIILKLGRKEFEKRLGMPITGSEKISSIYSNLINEKLNAYFSTPLPGISNTSPYPMVLSIILFLTIYPLGSIVSVILFLIVSAIFSMLVTMKLITISTINVEKQVVN